MDRNPSTSSRQAVPPESDARIRREHLGTEVALKFMATWFWLFLPLTASTPFHLPNGDLLSHNAVSGLLTVQMAVGLGLWQFKPWTRPIAAVVVCGSIPLPVGIPLAVYALHLLFGRKGRMVFSPRYPEIVQLTPKLRSGCSRTIEAIGIVAGLLFFGFLLAMATGH